MIDSSLIAEIAGILPLGSIDRRWLGQAKCDKREMAKRWFQSIG